MLNQLCEKIFVITTVDSDRVEYIQNHLDQRGVKFEFYVAPFYGLINPQHALHSPPQRESRPSISLTCAYYSIFEMCRINRIKTVAVLEDDCFLLEDWDTKLQRFYNKLPPDWDMLNLGYHPMHQHHSVKDIVNDLVAKPLDWHHTAHLMVARNTAYNPFKHMVNHWNWHIANDYVFNELYKRKEIKTYIPTEHMAYQLSYRKSLDELLHVKNTYVNFKSHLFNEF